MFAIEQLFLNAMDRDKGGINACVHQLPLTIDG